MKLRSKISIIGGLLLVLMFASSMTTVSASTWITGNVYNVWKYSVGSTSGTYSSFRLSDNNCYKITDGLYAPYGFEVIVYTKVTNYGSQSKRINLEIDRNDFRKIGGLAQGGVDIQVWDYTNSRWNSKVYLSEGYHYYYAGTFTLSGNEYQVSGGYAYAKIKFAVWAARPGGQLWIDRAIIESLVNWL